MFGAGVRRAGRGAAGFTRSMTSLLCFLNKVLGIKEESSPRNCRLLTSLCNRQGAQVKPGLEPSSLASFLIFYP